MWIDDLHIPRNTLLGLVLLYALAPAAGAVAEEGQYRSKILLTPEGEWARGAELSVEELERQLGSIEEAYAKSSAGRHLAHHYVARKEYDKAIEYYRVALSAEGLSAVANRAMLRELAQVYLLRKDYAAATGALQQALAIDLQAEAADYLLLARAYHYQARHVDVVAALDRIEQAGLALDAAQTQQALALYYRAGAYAQCEKLLHRLRELQPDDAQYWHLLASVYLQQDKKKEALDQLALAREKRVPFSEQQLMLLARLQAANHNPYGAAETLETALAQQEVAPSAANYRKLFEFWLQAREPMRAQAALQQAAQLSGDPQLSFYLAQLQMEQQDFQAMHRTILAACAQQLADQYVGRANLLLGISQLKLGDEAGARRSFINASLIGGVNDQAGQWLAFMHAAPATEDETRHIVSVCSGANDKRLDVDTSLAQASPPIAAAAPALAMDSAAFAIKTVPPERVFYMRYTQPLSRLVDALRGTVINMNVSLVKSGGSADGPLHIIFSGDMHDRDATPTLELALPARGPATPRGQFGLRTTQPFKCAYVSFEAPVDQVRDRLASLAEAVLAAGHQLTGEGRMLIPVSDNTDAAQFELQLGIR
jgi:tetratricopeptide (TPR) repeat protein